MSTNPLEPMKWAMGDQPERPITVCVKRSEQIPAFEWLMAENYFDDLLEGVPPPLRSAVINSVKLQAILEHQPKGPVEFTFLSKQADMAMRFKLTFG